MSRVSLELDAMGAAGGDMASPLRGGGGAAVAVAGRLSVSGAIASPPRNERRVPLEMDLRGGMLVDYKVKAQSGQQKSINMLPFVVALCFDLSAGSGGGDRFASVFYNDV